MKPTRKSLALAFLFLLPVVTTLKADEAILQRLDSSQPRLMVEAGTWESIRAKAERDPLLGQLVDQLLSEADRLMEQPLLERRKEGHRLLFVSREALGRISTWAMARHLTGDLRYARRAEAELLQVIQFKDWNPGHFLDLGEMTAAVALGYDWLYHDLLPESRLKIQNGLFELGLRPGLRAVDNHAWWLRADMNWNQVCLGGLTLGALAIADAYPEAAESMLQAARSSIKNGLSAYAPDGVYPEGPGYWAYGTVYQCMMIEGVRSALGTSWEMEQAPGFLQSAEAQLHLAGPTGRFFNFSDGREGPSLQRAMLWFARELGQPELAMRQKRLLQSGLEKTPPVWLGILPILWWPDADTSQSTIERPLAWHGRGKNPVAVFRSCWEDPEAFYLACKGGKADLNHGQMDAGSFVMEAKGVRWALDLGMQRYQSLERSGISLWDFRQEGERWDIFRLNNRSHNTLTINDALHRIGGRARFTDFDASGAGIDLSEVFAGQAEAVHRRFEIGEESFSVTDHLEGLEPGARVRWAMATRAQIAINGREAILTEAGEQIKIRLGSNTNGIFHFIPADPPEDGFNAPNPGVYLLLVDAGAPASGELTIELRFDFKSI